MNFNFKNTDRENIKQLNEIMGTNYRTKPYNIKNTDDLIEMIEMITAEYVDMAHYWSVLVNIDENFDESLEVFNPAAWVNIGLKGTTYSDIIDEAISSLRHTTNLFGDIMDESEKRCIEIWKFILKNPVEKVHKYFFDELVNYSDEIIDRALSEDYIFEIFAGINYDGIVENSAKMFSENLVKALKFKKKYNL